MASSGAAVHLVRGAATLMNRRAMADTLRKSLFNYNLERQHAELASGCNTLVNSKPAAGAGLYEPPGQRAWSRIALLSFECTAEAPRAPGRGSGSSAPASCCSVISGDNRWRKMFIAVVEDHHDALPGSTSP